MHFFGAKKEDFEMIAEISDEQMERAREVGRQLGIERWHRWQMLFRMEKEREEGILEGHRTGPERSYEEDFRLGQQLERRRVAFLLLRRDMPHEDIAEITDMSIDEIRQLINSYPFIR